MTTIFLTSDATWTVPADWNNSDNTVEVIGEGGKGQDGSTSLGGDGGGGGAYSKASNVSLTPGTTLASGTDYQIGSGGTSTDTWLKDGSSTIVVLAKCGGNGDGVSGHNNGGDAASGIGDVKYSGGNGGHITGNAGHGGAGSAGPDGAGRNGYAVTSGAGQGGGGANGLLSADAPATFPYAGGAGPAGDPGGAGSNDRNIPGVAGVNGSGGGGGFGASGFVSNGGAGSQYDIWTDNSGGPHNGNTAGPGSGGGGAGGTVTGDTSAKRGGDGGGFGGGGGGGPRGTPPGTGGAGAPGIIVITYTPGGLAAVSRSFGSIIA